MPKNLRQILDENNITKQVIIPTEIDTLLISLFITDPPPEADIPQPLTGPLSGKVKGGADQSLLGFASLKIDRIGPEVGFTLTLSNGSAFTIDLNYDSFFKLPAGLKGATIQDDGDKKVLNAIVPDIQVALKGVVLLRIAGSATTPATMRLLGPGAEDAVLTMTCDPPAFLWGDSGFGLHLPDGIVLDDSMVEAPPPPTHALAPFASQNPAWRGIAIRNAELFIPETTPLIGGIPIPIDVEIGSPVGIDARTQVRIPAQDKRPEIAATVEWRDPTAASLDKCLPTSIELVAQWQVKDKTTTFSDTPVTLGGGNPLTARARFARDLRDQQMKFDLSLQGGGQDGLIAVTAGSGDTVPKIFVTATALATALVADAQVNPDPQRDASGTTLHLLLVAATALSSFFTDRGRVVVHGAEIAGDVALANAPLRFRVDYSVDVVVKPISLGALSISMNGEVPMRIRYRDVGLEVDFTKSGPEMFSLSFAGCSVLVEDPGGWIVHSPGSLLDILGTRSGHGSTWFEVDMRFALDLGPVKVSGATLRATFDDANLGQGPKVILRGLDVTLQVPDLLTGQGLGRITENGFDAGLAVQISKLGIGAKAFVRYQEVGDIREVLLDIGLDLPAPIPVANSGLGIFGLGGVFAINGMLPPPNPGQDPLVTQLTWKPTQPNAIPVKRGGMVLGLGAVLGTIPDLGYAFSTKAMIIASTPDIAVRAALDARFVTERAEMSELGTPPPDVGLRVLGLLVIDDTAVSLALRGTFDMPVLLHTEIPVAAFYPYGKNDWFLHIGSDTVPGPDGRPLRGPGPVAATLLPDLLDINGYAYLMLDGNGIPNLGGTGFNPGGFALGMGFGFDIVYPLGVIWLEMSAHAVIGMASNPLMLIGLGGLSGSLHLGPFSLGVTADVKFQVGPGDKRVLYFKVCGEVDLWLTTLRGCVEIGTDTQQGEVTDPKTAVLDHVGLMDWNGQELATATLVPGDDPGAPPQNLPIVWPDAIPVLEFSTGPIHNLTDGLSANINKAMAGNGLYGSDELRYTYTLSQLDLLKQDKQTLAWVPQDLSLWPTTGAWQLPRHSSASNPDLLGARELALLTGEMHIWTRLPTDGAVGLPEDPLKAIPELCGKQFFAIPGWALGVDAISLESSAHWMLPAEGSQQGRLQSHFNVDLVLSYRQRALTPLFALSSSFSNPLDQGGPVAFASPLDGGSRTFRGGFAVPHFITPTEVKAELGAAEARLTFSELLSKPVLYILWSGNTGPDQTFTPVALLTTLGTSAPLSLKQTLPLPGGGLLLVYVLELADEVQVITMNYDATSSWQILGIQGITHTATQAANDATENAKKAAAINTVVANDPPGQRKPLLDPDTVYKIVVTIDRQGQLKDQVPQPLGHQVTSYYFRTAALTPALSPFSSIDSFTLLRKVDSFDPAYLARYLIGWTPEDKTEYWFCGDPVAAHFNVDHIAALAERYGHEVFLRVQRTDTPPGHPDQGVEFTKIKLQDFAAPHLALASDRRLANFAQEMVAAGQPCRIPLAGASHKGDPPLVPNARYDLAVAFPKKGDAYHGNVIPGIIFGTSRYQGPRDLLLALGFDPAGGTSHVSGDVPVSSVPIDGGAIGDRALEEAMERLGLPVWPATRDARTTALWVQDGPTWKLAGVLLEASEPIHRSGPRRPGSKPEPERLGVDALTCGDQTFEIVRRNACGSRILFMTTNPFTPAAPLQLTAHEVPPLSPDNSVPIPITAHCQVATLPAFLEETI